MFPKFFVLLRKDGVHEVWNYDQTEIIAERASLIWIIRDQHGNFTAVPTFAIRIGPGFDPGRKDR